MMKNKCVWTGKLSISRYPTSNHKQWLIERPLAVSYQRRTGVDEPSFTIAIKPGLFTDGASIVKPLWSIIGCPLRGKYAPGAIMHDALYASHAISRKASDKIFYKLIRDSGVNILRAKAMYRAVRLFGMWAWNGHGPEENKRLEKLVSVEVV